MPLKPFLTPEFTSEDWQCRTLRTPNNKEWLGVFNSALLEMTNEYSWEQVETSDLTIEEAIAIVQGILVEFFATEECTGDGACLQPDGSRVLSLSLDGHIRQLANGAWEAPADDYTIPPVPEREETTALERRCAAALNAQNVLKEVYEVAADAIAGGLDEAEIIAAMAAYLVAAIGIWLGLAIAALAFAVLALFRAFIEIAEFMTIDLWDAAFSDLLTCVLFGCASDDGDVVTFDFTCVNEQMAASVDLSGIDALNQLRLFGQVSFILNVIGVDGLNAAGATTAITTGDCDECEAWCHEFDFELDDQGWSPDVLSGQDLAVWSSGNGWRRACSGSTPYCSRAVFIHIEVNAYLTSIGVETINQNHQQAGVAYNSPYYPSEDGTLISETDAIVVWSPEQFVTTLGVGFDKTGAGGGLTSKIVRVVLNGTGTNPFTDNCE